MCELEVRIEISIRDGRGLVLRERTAKSLNKQHTSPYWGASWKQLFSLSPALYIFENLLVTTHFFPRLILLSANNSRCPQPAQS